MQACPETAALLFIDQRTLDSVEAHHLTFFFPFLLLFKAQVTFSVARWICLTTVNSMNIFLEGQSRLSRTPPPPPQPQILRKQTYMDEAEQQLLHEYRHATAKASYEMASPSSTKSASSPTPGANTPSPIAAHEGAHEGSSFSQMVPHNPMEALQS